MLRAAAYMWTALDNLLGSLILVLLEVLHEQGTQLLDLALEIRSAVPALRGVEQLVRDIGAGLWHRQVEGVVNLVLDVCKLAGVNGVQDRASVLERATLSSCGRAGTDPTGVEEPCVRTVFFDLLCKHSGVAHGVKGEEGLGEARGEGGLGLGDTLLGSGHLGGITGDEVVHGLGGGELGDWRKNTTGVACEEDDVLGVAVGNARDLGVLDVLDGVCATSVLGEGGVIVIDNSGGGVEDDVLKDGAKLDGVENIGLLLGGETNALGVAAALNVEDALVAPAVLVVTDQGTLGVGRESCLASAGETEEDGNISVLTLVGRGVKSEDVVLDGHLVVKDGENTLWRY